MFPAYAGLILRWSVWRVAGFNVPRVCGVDSDGVTTVETASKENVDRALDMLDGK